MNQEIEHSFDDDYMLQLALSMSLQTEQREETPAPATREETPMDVTVQEEATQPTSPQAEVPVEPAATPLPSAAAAPPQPAAKPEVVAAAAAEPVAAPVQKKKRVKKNKYKDLMAGVTASTRTAEQDKKVFEQRFQKATGGGAFAKIDKI